MTPDADAIMPRKDKIRYFTWRDGAAGEMRRYFWQPSAVLREQGWLLQRLPEDFERYSDDAALYAAAAGAAIEINGRLDAARRSQEAAPPPVPAAQKRTVGNLVKAYKLDDAYSNLGSKSRTDYDRCLDRIVGWAGDCRIEAVDRDRVKKLYKGMSHTPSMANAVIRVLRLVMNWGKRNKVPGGGMWVVTNPADKPGLAPAAVSGRIIPREAVRLFVEKADALDLFGLGTAIVLDEWLGQREADILRIPETIIRKGCLVFRQAKGSSLVRGTLGAGVVLPVQRVPVLWDRLQAQIARNKAVRAELERKGLAKLIRLNIIQREDGGAYKADWFRHSFARVREGVEADMLTAAGWSQDDAGAWRKPEAENPFGNYPKKERAALIEKARRRDASFEIDYLLPGRDSEDPDAFHLYIGEMQYMHLRHTAITRLAECGCTPEEIAAISGHSLKTVMDILERYLIRTMEMAANAFDKRLVKEAGGQVKEMGDASSSV